MSADFFIDTEFIENGHREPLRLISIGLCDLKGRTYYAEDAEADLGLANDWVKANVVPHLCGPRKDRATIRNEVVEFIRRSLAPVEKPRFWGYFADYDWVLLAQLFGTMVSLPSDFPYYCHDLKQWADQLGVEREDYPKQDGTEHNALADARWNRDLFRFLSSREASR